MFLGPVIRDFHKVRTVKYIKIGEQEGTKLIRDGRNDETEKGNFVGPTIFDHVTVDMTIWKDEIFAPVLSVVGVDTLDEAIELANKSDFANGACIYTRTAATYANSVRISTQACWG